jgi:hypothetical protein
MITEHSTFVGELLGPEMVLTAGLGVLFVLIFLVGLTKVSNDQRQSQPPRCLRGRWRTPGR